MNASRIRMRVNYNLAYYADLLFINLLIMYNFSKISNITQLSGLLRTDIVALEILDTKLYRGSEPLVKTMKIPKKNKSMGFRIVYKINVEKALNALKHLKFILNNTYMDSEYAYGFVRNRSIRDNAAKHLNKKKILHIDIRDFFDNIDITKVRSVFLSMGFIDSIASILSNMVTCENKLAQGFPTSPTLANMVCADMDSEIGEVCNSNNLTYTRYADDITISGDEINILNEVQQILRKFGFELNECKTKYSHIGQSQYVTGLTVSDVSYPRIPVKIKRKMRQKLYFISKYGIKSHVEKITHTNNIDHREFENLCHKELCYIKGWLDFIYSIEPMFTAKYQPLLIEAYTKFKYKHI